MKEDEIRDKVMHILFANLGEQKTWEGEGKFARFKLRSQFGGAECSAEHSINYKLPNGSTLSHKSDIFIAQESLRRFVSLEIKHVSAVTDQFKCRSYDMTNMKATYGKRLLGIMLYVRTTKGISASQAQKICYPFDHFFGVRYDSENTDIVPDRLMHSIANFLQ